MKYTKAITLIYLILFSASSFATLPLLKKRDKPIIFKSKMEDTYSRTHLTVEQNYFTPGNDWEIMGNALKDNNDHNVYGQEIRIRYEKYLKKYFDFRFGLNIRTIGTPNLSYNSFAYALDIVDNVYQYNKFYVYSVLSSAYSPEGTIKVYDEKLKGPSWKFSFGFEFAYFVFKHWLLKITPSYDYEKLQNYQKTTKYNPSYMTLTGPALTFGLSYKF